MLPGKRKRVVWLAVAVILAAGGAGAWLLLRPPPAESTQETMTAAASVGTQRQTVSATGTVQPADRADLGFAVSGEVTEVLVTEGDAVTAGQVLATVDDELLAAEVDAASSELEAAQARRDDDTAAGASDTQLAADDAAVVSASSRLTAAQEALDQADLTSTIAGTVASVDLAVGDQVGAPDGQSDDSTAPGITVVSTGTFLVEAAVAGSDVERIKAGMAAEVVPVDAVEPVAGTVRTVGLVAEADDSGVATFPVTVDLTGEPKGVFAGSSATVSIIVEEREDVLTVPTQAVHGEGGDTYVDKIVNGSPVRTDVEVGTAYGPVTEIVSGLAEGDEVELAGFTRPQGGGGDDDGGGGGNTRIFPGGGGGPVMPGGKIEFGSK